MTTPVKIAYVADSESIFPIEDIKLLSEHYTVTAVPINLIEKNYVKMLKIGLTRIIPATLKSNVSITWTADYHTFFTVLVSKLFMKKSIVHISGMEVANFPEINYGYQTKFIRGHIVRWILRNASAIIVPSESYAKKTRILTKKPVYVVPNYSDVTTENMLPKKEPMVIMVANQYMNSKDFSALKGITMYNALAYRMQDIPFYLIGEIKEDIRESCKYLHYYGSVPHWIVIDYLKLSKVYCQLSYTESFGVSLLEALQAGCIPVVVNKDGMAELVENNGYKIDYNDTSAAVKAIREALTATKIPDYAEYYRSKYTKENRKEDLSKVIEKVVGAK
jgi:glycosyltransferase involved in cell wall biosynthesis